MPVSPDSAQLDAPADLITLLQALSSCRMRRGVRYPQWWMLLVAILAILSGHGSLVGMERFAKRHLALLKEVLGLEIRKPPSDSTFRYLFLQLDVVAFEALLLHWMSQQPALVDGVDTLVCDGVCDGKTLRGSIDQKPGAAATFIAQVSLYSQALGVAIAQTTYAPAARALAGVERGRTGWFPAPLPRSSGGAGQTYRWAAGPALQDGRLHGHWSQFGLAVAAAKPHVGGVEGRGSRNSQLSPGVVRSGTAGGGPRVSGPGDRSASDLGGLRAISTAASTPG